MTFMSHFQVKYKAQFDMTFISCFIGDLFAKFNMTFMTHFKLKYKAQFNRILIACFIGDIFAKSI